MSQDQQRGSTAAAPHPDDAEPAILQVAPGESGSTIIEKLGLPVVGGDGYPAAVIVLVGTTDLPDDEQQTGARLVQLFGRGLARAAVGNRALIIDASTGDEAAVALSRAMFDASDRALLVRISTESPATVGGGNGALASTATTTRSTAFSEPAARYTHYISVQNSNAISEVVNAITDAVAGSMPVLTLLVNGDARSEEVIAHSVRRGRPVLVVRNSGGLSDQIWTQWQAKLTYLQDLTLHKSGASSANEQLPFIKDPRLAEIIAEGDLHFFSVTDTPEKLMLYINQRFQECSILDLAQAQQKLYSEAANTQEQKFRWLQLSIVALGVVITALAAFQTFYKQVQMHVPMGGTTLDVALNYILIALPVILAVLIAGTNRFNPGNKWIMLRAGSQALKREIFRYRTRTGIYSDAQTARNATTREAVLAKMIEAISRQWIEGNVEYTLFPPPASLPSANGTMPAQSRLQLNTAGGLYSLKEPLPKLSAYLPPDRYVTERLQEQIDYYKKKCARLSWELHWLQWIILALGGLATALAALHFEWVITITTALATAGANYLEYNQVSNSLKQYNHAILNLNNVQNWWISLDEAQADPLNIDKLVDYVETILQSEQAGWIQQMQAALTELRAQQAVQGSNSAATEPIHQPQNGQVLPSSTRAAGSDGAAAAGDDQQEDQPAPPTVSDTTV